MALTKVGQIWEITSPDHPCRGDKFLITSPPIQASDYIQGCNVEDMVWVEYRCLNGSPGQGSLSWIRHDCTLCSEPDYPTR